MDRLHDTKGHAVDKLVVATELTGASERGRIARARPDRLAVPPTPDLPPRKRPGHYIRLQTYGCVWSILPPRTPVLPLFLRRDPRHRPASPEAGWTDVGRRFAIRSSRRRSRREMAVSGNRGGARLLSLSARGWLWRRDCRRIRRRCPEERSDRSGGDRETRAVLARYASGEIQVAVERGPRQQIFPTIEPRGGALSRCALGANHSIPGTSFRWAIQATTDGNFPNQKSCCCFPDRKPQARNR